MQRHWGEGREKGHPGRAQGKLSLEVRSKERSPNGAGRRTGELTVKGKMKRVSHQGATHGGKTLGDVVLGS